MKAAENFAVGFLPIFLFSILQLLDSVQGNALRKYHKILQSIMRNLK